MIKDNPKGLVASMAEAEKRMKEEPGRVLYYGSGLPLAGRTDFKVNTSYSTCHNEWQCSTRTIVLQKERDRTKNGLSQPFIVMASSMQGKK